MQRGQLFSPGRASACPEKPACPWSRSSHDGPLRAACAWEMHGPARQEQSALWGRCHPWPPAWLCVKAEKGNWNVQWAISSWASRVSENYRCQTGNCHELISPKTNKNISKRNFLAEGTENCARERCSCLCFPKACYHFLANRWHLQDHWDLIWFVWIDCWL